MFRGKAQTCTCTFVLRVYKEKAKKRENSSGFLRDSKGMIHSVSDRKTAIIPPDVNIKSEDYTNFRAFDLAKVSSAEGAVHPEHS